MAVKPITPDDVLSRRVAMIPDFVIEAVNDLLVKARGDDQIMLKQDVIVEAIIAKMRQVNTDALRRRISADVNDAVQTIPVLPRLAVTCVDHVVGACPLTTLDGFRVVQPVNVASVIAREVGLPHVYQSTSPTANAITEQIIL